MQLSSFDPYTVLSPQYSERCAMAHNLIASDRVEGTSVCRPTGEKIGEIQRLMIDKVSGKVAYAILSFGGFLGFAQKHFPVPWSSLKYNLQSSAYELEVTEISFAQHLLTHQEKSSTGVTGPMKSSFAISQFTADGSDCAAHGTEHRFAATQ